MNQYKVDLYDFCSNPIKDALEMFCDQVNCSDADVYIIMAHKAVLLFRILLAQGYIDKQVEKKIIITNLALDFDCDYLKGKKIVILDDIVISGTSIASTVNKLMSFGVLQDDIEVIAVAIDQYYFAMQFDNTNGIGVFHCDYMMEDALCIELSSTISKAFSYYGIPYDMDFPVYDELLINAEQLNILHNNLLWDIIDVSNGNQKASGVTAYTLLPTQTVRSRLWRTLGAELEKCTDIKIRMYIMRYPDGTLECCIVPMCLFKEISVDNLGILYDLLKPSDQTALLNHNKSCIAQMRYLEFFIAHKLYLIFSEITSLGKGLMFREDIAKRLFGLNDGETVYRHLCNSYSNSASYPTIQVDHMMVNDVSIIDEYKGSFIYKKSCKDNINWANGSAFEQGCSINRFIFEPFMWWYDEKEIKVRKQLKEKAFHYVKNYKEIERCLFRLKNGLPMSMLKQMLRDRVPGLSDAETEHTISAFLDRAIDEGIIVPTIHYCTDQKYICRAYRHGEDLPFGAADQYRLVYFVQLIGEKINAEENGKLNNKYPEIGAISLEKMIVLFYQMGLKQGNIFNRFLGFDNIDIIHSFLSVHGTIQGYTNPKVSPRIYSERDSQGNRYITWLTTWLYETGLIGEKPDNTGIDDSRHIPIKLDRIAEYLKKNERSTVSDAVLGHIESLAELITTWYNSMAQRNKKIEFRDNITALTSCANRFVYASAIATEIHYFSNYWNHQAQYALQEKRDYQRLVNRLTDNDENRKYTSTIIEGLHSGRMKVIWRNEKKAGEIIDGVKSFLNSTSANVWIQLWSDVDTNSDYKSDELKTYTNIAEGFLYFFSACLECLKSGEFWSSGIMPQSYDDYKKCYLQLVNSGAFLDKALFNEIERIAELDANDLGEKGRQLDKLVQDGLFSSEECVCKIEEKVREWDPIYTVSYTSTLILDINALNPSRIEEALMRFWEQLPEDGTKTTLNLIRFPEKSNTYPYVKYGIFLGEKTSQPLDVHQGRTEDEIAKTGKFLYKVFKTLCSLLNGKIYAIRGILLPHIMQGPTSLFRHNLQRNIEKNASEFYDTIIKPLEVCYDDKWQMQLVLGLDRYVDRQLFDPSSEWTSTIFVKCEERAKWVSTCIVCGKDYIRLNGDRNSLMDRIAYSQLNVECGGNRGLGILLRLSERIVCISCNHIFVKHSSGVQAKAVSAFSPNVTFELNPLTEVYQYRSESHILEAKDEVIVLEPCWNGDIPFAISKLVSIEDMSNGFSSMECMCYGCNAEGQMKWVDSIHVVGPITKGYYQIGGEIGKIQRGFSGGIYVGNDSHTGEHVLGIHEGRFDHGKEARMIPWSSIQDAINQVSERGIADVEST